MNYINDLTGRTDLQGKTLSNGRTDLWKQAYDAFTLEPMFGTSPRNMESVSGVRGLHTPHNGILALLFYNGIVGGIIMIPFFVMCFVNRNKTKGFMYNKGLKGYCVLSYVLVLCMLFESFFLHEVFWMNSVGSFLFWFALGGVVPIYANRRNEREVRVGGLT